MGSYLDPAAYTIGQWAFIKTIFLCYLIAFGSLLPQIRGLIGKKGILPVANYLERVRAAYGKSSFSKVPTIFWLRSDDGMLLAVSYAGMALSVLGLFGAPAAPTLLLLYFGYLSFVSIGQDFLSFQWDALLLETGFFAVFFALVTPAPFVMLLAGWFLFFRFIFSSGVVKVLSQCQAWRSLTAMGYHYETQPLPTRPAWYAHQMPAIFGKIQTVAVFFIEMFLPFLILFPPDIRSLMAIVQIGFQVLIVITGNYTFFNILTIGMACLLIDNSCFPVFFQGVHVAPFFMSSGIMILLLSLVGAVFLYLNMLQLISLFTPLGSLHKLLAASSHWYLVNSYGLFARMTTERNEIVIEGSDDGEIWRQYWFLWKPQDLMEPPRRVAPHQPRLDWQMWFAALGKHYQNEWFHLLVYRLLEGSPEVLGLLKGNPFPNKPPAVIRAQLYRYHFTDRKTRRETGQWWVREYIGEYFPAVSLT